MRRFLLHISDSNLISAPRSAPTYVLHSVSLVLTIYVLHSVPHSFPISVLHSVALFHATSCSRSRHSVACTAVVYVLPVYNCVLTNDN